MHLGGLGTGKGARFEVYLPRVEERAESGRDRKFLSAYPSNRDSVIAEDEEGLESWHPNL